MGQISRRMFIELGAMALASGATLAQQPVSLSKEGWVLQETAEADQQIENVLRGHPLASLLAHSRYAQEYKNTHHFAHAFVRIGGYDIHGLPSDPIDGKRREFTNLSNSILQVFPLTLADSNADRDSHHHPQEESKPIHLSGRFATLSQSEILGKFLDMGAAINAARFNYIPFSTSRAVPPINSNSVYSAMLEQIGLCPAENCLVEEHDFGLDLVPGINAGLPSKSIVKSNLGTKYFTMAKNGKGMDDLVRTFNTDHKLQLAKHAAQSLLVLDKPNLALAGLAV